MEKSRVQLTEFNMWIWVICLRLDHFGPGLKVVTAASGGTSSSKTR